MMTSVRGDMWMDVFLCDFVIIGLIYEHKDEGKRSDGYVLKYIFDEHRFELSVKTFN